MVNNHYHRLALINNISKLLYPNVFCRPDYGIVNVVGAKVEDPDDGHEDNQDQDGSEDKDSPQREDTKDDSTMAHDTILSSPQEVFL